MDTEFYNKETAMRKNERAAGCILLERADNGNWIAMEWSAFFVYLLFHSGTCRYYLNQNAHAVAELPDSDLYFFYRQLTVLVSDNERIVFSALGHCEVPPVAFDYWKKRLAVGEEV